MVFECSFTIPRYVNGDERSLNQTVHFPLTYLVRYALLAYRNNAGCVYRLFDIY